jgi:hypothetical protein
LYSVDIDIVQTDHAKIDAFTATRLKANVNLLRESKDSDDLAIN